MATHLIAYVPYAAAAYCIAKVGQHVWPSLRSQISQSTQYSSVRGSDGSDPVYSRMAQDCPGGVDAFHGGFTTAGSRANPDNPYVRNAPPYCYNVDTGEIEGDGPLDGTKPPETTVMLFTDDDGTELAMISISGDADITIPLCSTAEPFKFTTQTPPPDEPFGFTTRPRTPPPEIPPGQYIPPAQYVPPEFTPGGCERRPRPMIPQFIRGTCDDPAYRQARLASKRNRWG